MLLISIIVPQSPTILKNSINLVLSTQQALLTYIQVPTNKVTLMPHTLSHPAHHI